MDNDVTAGPCHFYGEGGCFTVGQYYITGQPSDICKENWEDIPLVEISLKLEGDQLGGRAVFYVVDPGAGEVVK